MNEFVGTINIHNVTKEDTYCTLVHLDNSTVIAITIGITTINLFVDNDQAVAIKRILGS